MGNIKFATESRNGIDGFSIQYNDYPKSYYFGGVENLSSDADEIFFQKEGKYFVYNPSENNILINGVDVTANGVSAIKTQLESDIFPANSGLGETYLVYTARLSQTGTDAPIATVLGDNTIGDIVWTRNDQGIYFGTLAGAFTLNKTWFSIVGENRNSLAVAIDRATDDVVRYFTSDDTWTPVDGENVYIEIRVYP